MTGPRGARRWTPANRRNPPERPVEEALALREKFNKQIYMEVSMLTASAGFRF